MYCKVIYELEVICKYVVCIIHMLHYMGTALYKYLVFLKEKGTHFSSWKKGEKTKKRNITKVWQSKIKILKFNTAEISTRHLSTTCIKIFLLRLKTYFLRKTALLLLQNWTISKTEIFFQQKKHFGG